MKQIVVNQSDWAVVGDVTRTADEIVICNAIFIRAWKTVVDLGWLAANGPIEWATKLDPIGRVRMFTGQIVALIDCDESAWAQPIRRGPP